MSHKKYLLTIFLAIFINITGFSLIFPLSPALLNFYLPNQEISGDFLGQTITTIKTLIASIGKENPSFTTAVFFGCFLASLYALLQFIFAPIFGRISDYYGRRPILLITITGTTLSYALWIFADTFNLFIISRILAGITAANLSVASAAMADITSKKDRTKGMALIGIAFGLGFLFGPAIGGLLTQINLLHLFPSLNSIGINPFSSCALFATLLSLINLLWIYLQFQETLLPEKRNKNLFSFKFSETFRSQSPSIFKTNFSYFIFILAFSGLEFSIAFVATERFNYSSTMIGFLFLYIGFILILSRGYIISKLASKIEERYIALAGILSGMISFFIIAFAFTQPLFILGNTFLSLAVALTSTSLSSLVSLYSTEITQGRDIGLFNSAGSLARACGPLLASIPYIYLGAKGAYLSVSSFLFIPLIIIVTLPKPIKLPEPIPSIPSKVIEDSEPPSI